MLRRLRDAITPSKGKSFGGAFSRLGWAGFWLQVVFGSLPMLIMAYYFAFSSPESSAGFGFGWYLTIINLLILIYYLLVVPLHADWQKNKRSGDRSVRTLLDRHGLDRSGGDHGGHALFHARRP